jgi:hypothetical protein
VDKKRKLEASFISKASKAKPVAKLVVSELEKTNLAAELGLLLTKNLLFKPWRKQNVLMS